jgi:hypothetical protein
MMGLGRQPGSRREFFDKPAFRSCNGGVSPLHPPRAHEPPRWRAHFGVWATLAGVIFGGLVLAAPPAPPATIAAPAPGGGAVDAGMSVVWLALARTLTLLVLGEPQARLRLLSCAAAAVSVVLLFWRASSDQRISGDHPDAAAPIVGASFGTLAVALSRSFFQAATSAGPLAVGALLAIAALTLAERVLRSPGDARAGWGLAAVAGVAVGGPMGAAALGWPLAGLAVLRALRRRARWLVPAAILFATVALVSLVGLARVPGRMPVGALARQVLLVPLLRGLGRLTGAALVAAAADLSDQIGVLGLLVAATGLLRLRRVALVFTLWPLVGGLVLRAVWGPGPEGTIGLITAVSALALPIGVGTGRLAERLGRAALPAAATIGVIVATWPLLAR